MNYKSDILQIIELNTNLRRTQKDNLINYIETLAKENAELRYEKSANRRDIEAFNREKKDNRETNIQIINRLLQEQEKNKQLNEEISKLKKELSKITKKYNKIMDDKFKKEDIKETKILKNYKTYKAIREIRDVINSSVYYDSDGYENLDGIGVQNIRDIINSTLSDYSTEEEEC